MAQYLDPNVYHEELVKCIKTGKLSEKMIEMFKLHAYNVTRRFYIPNKDDKDDAVGNCLRDFCLYWKNFAIENCLQLKFSSEFMIGDKFIIHIRNFGDIVCIAGDKMDIKNNIFEIKDTINRTIKSMMEICQQDQYKDVLKVTNHSVSYKFAITDLYNKEDLSIFSYVKCEPVEIEGRPEFIKPDKLHVITDENIYNFRNCSRAFLFLTSLCNNSIIKSLSQTSPAPLRFGNRVRLSLNSENNGIYTL